MRVAIAGGTGFIGTALTKKLVSLGVHVYILTRNPAKKRDDHPGITYVEWLTEKSRPEKALTGVDAIINLAGENLNSGRWTKAVKHEIYESRIRATREVVKLIEAMDEKPEVLINGSAIGYYGTSLSNMFTEKSGDSGNDFLAEVVHAWEQEAAAAEASTRVVYARFGMVLDKTEGALAKMLLPFKLFIGGNLGSGEQWMSWIHIDELVRAIVHCIEEPSVTGPVNMTAPNPLKMKDFGKILAKTLRRPYWAPVPAFVLKIVLGEMSILVTEGQKVLPARLEESGFSFQYSQLQPALKDLLTDK